MLEIHGFCDFARYLTFWLYFGCMDFPHFLQPQDHQNPNSVGVVCLGCYQNQEAVG